MTGPEFEHKLCLWFREHGYWALNVPKNQFGAQPFDVLAIKGSMIWAVDAKVCSEPRLRLNRVEDNQMLAFDAISQKTDALCGFMCLHDGLVYFVPYEDVKKEKSASIKLIDNGFMVMGRLEE